MSGRFAFNGGSRRMVITDRDDENDDRELHCGDCFDLKVGGDWFPVRIEHSAEWYLIGLPSHCRSAARFYEGSEVRL